jgi:hypothetical protein
MAFSNRHWLLRVPEVVLGVFCMAATVAACSPSTPKSSGADSAAVAQQLADSLARAEQQHAAELGDSARAALSSLLKDPASATFDSLMVVQPPPVNGRPSPMVVCGRIRGKPGIGGRSGPAAFVYQNRMTVFVADASNKQAFGEIWGETCGHPQARIIVR